jgi:hypothetical protein
MIRWRLKLLAYVSLTLSFRLAHEGAVDAEALKKGALEVLARKYFIPADQKVKPQKSE